MTRIYTWKQAETVDEIKKVKQYNKDGELIATYEYKISDKLDSDVIIFNIVAEVSHNNEIIIINNDKKLYFDGRDAKLINDNTYRKLGLINNIKEYNITKYEYFIKRDAINILPFLNMLYE